MFVGFSWTMKGMNLIEFGGKNGFEVVTELPLAKNIRSTPDKDFAIIADPDD